MRRLSALLVAVLPLAACGGGSSAGSGANMEGEPVAGPASFDRADGSFDRARYRIAGIRSCTMGIRSEDPRMPAGDVTRMCTCLVDGQLAANSDAVLRATLSDPAVSRRTLDAAARQCNLPLPTDADMGLTNGAAPRPAGDEPPPPEEPVPTLNAGLPPPIAQAPPPRR